MRAFTLLLKWLAPIPVLAGSLHLLLGVHADVILGARLPAEALADPVLDSQNRFYGVAFMAYGVFLYLCATDLRKYAAVFKIVVGLMFAGGVARLIAAVLHGIPAPPVILLAAVELVGMPLLLLWYLRVQPKAAPPG